MNWQDEVTTEQWNEWQEFARKVSQQKKINTTLGAEDYAASAIEKLISQPKKPENVEAWLRKTINNQYIDRFRKIQMRGGASMRELTDEQWEEGMISFAVGSPSALVYIRESVDEVLAVLTEKEREILILSAAGFNNHQIANYLFYKNNKIVATRLAQIIEKVQKSVAKIGTNPNSK